MKEPFQFKRETTNLFSENIFRFLEEDYKATGSVTLGAQAISFLELLELRSLQIHLSSLKLNETTKKFIGNKEIL